MSSPRFRARARRRLLFVAAGLILVGSLRAQRAEDRAPPPPSSVPFGRHFDFGSGAGRSGDARVDAATTYTAERGFGLDFGSKPVGVAPRDEDVRGGGFITTEHPPLFFSVRVPEGNYRVTVTLGDPAGESDATIRTEAGQLAVADLATRRGQIVTRTFYANVRRPELPTPPKNAPGGTTVHMFLPGEAESRIWDDKLTIEFNGTRPCIRAIDVEKDDKVPTLFVAGDSTVADPRSGPGGNWPTQMVQFLKPDIAVCNSAQGGETSKSFVTGLRLDKVLSQMKPGDFLLAQFGHNDSKAQWPQTYTEPATTFKAYLGVFLAETTRHGGTLVLVTPMERRANGDTVGAWARAMKEFGAENHVAVIDQWTVSKELWTALGDHVGSAFVDPTHLSGYGGYLLARLMVRGIQQNVPALARHVVDDFQPMDPAHPEAPPAYLRQKPLP